MTNPAIFEREDIQSLFEQLDKQAQQDGVNLEVLVIGSGMLIHGGMPNRFTVDVDFWDTGDATRTVLAGLSRRIGVEFDPTEYRHIDHRYLQWVSKGFVHMPERDDWMLDCTVAWEGQALRVLHPPIGIILGSKMGANRDNDFNDIKYIVGNMDGWRESLNRYLPLFSQEHQKDIMENMVMVGLMEQAQENTVASLDTLLPSKSKRVITP